MLPATKACREMSHPQEKGLDFRPLSPAIFTDFVADTPRELQKLLSLPVNFGDSFVGDCLHTQMAPVLPNYLHFNAMLSNIISFELLTKENI